MAHILDLLGSRQSQVDEKRETLKRKLQFLESIEDDIKEELKQTEYSVSGKKPKKEVQNWLAEVDKLKSQVQQNEQEVQERRSRWINSQLEKNVEKLTVQVEDLIKQGKFPRGLTLESFGNQGVALITTRLIGEMFQRNKNTIWDCLVNGEDSMIGIHGMGGVGKTTLLKHIYNQLCSDRPNDPVLWVTVSQDFKIEKLQNDIAKRLWLDLSDENQEQIRAAKLASALKKRRNVTLIFDNVWDHISIDKVGICVGVNGCKLIFSTRDSEVCLRMNCQKIIKVEPLSHGEAWTLFTETLHETQFPPQIEVIAETLVKECGGLPLAIITMAGSMKGANDICEWRNALKDMEVSKYRKDEFCDVFRVLKYSYDRLKDPKEQQCLLYCSLFPEDEFIKRDKLIEYFIDEKLIDAMNSRQSAFDKGHTILNKLERVCLLEGKANEVHERKKKSVKMHDLVREMAIKIRSENPRFLVKSGEELVDIVEEKWTEDVLRVSLMRNKISISSGASPKCPELRTILLRDNDYLFNIPDCFFMHMQKLSVLDLSYTSIRGLPTSISDLGSLTALLLRKCERLDSLPSFANLKSLRRLDLSYTLIKELPEGMPMLINLRYLKFDHCLELQIIPDGILPRISQIQYLESGETKVNAGEIAYLNKLETYKGLFRCIDDDLNSCIKSWDEGGPENYAIFVGSFLNQDTGFSRESLFNKQVTLRTNGLRIVYDSLVIPASLQFLRIEYCYYIKCLCDVQSLKKSTDLRDCFIDSCGTLSCILCSHNCYCSLPLVRSLETLYLCALPALTDIIRRERTSSAPPAGTLSSLRTLKIDSCDRIKGLFTPGLLSHLQSLETLQVYNCKGLVEIIEASHEDEDDMDTVILTLPKLRYLQLDRLPKLKSFCTSSFKVSDSLEVISIVYCPELKKISLLCEESCSSTLSLQAINVQQECWESLEWKHPETKDVLLPFCRFLLVEKVTDSLTIEDSTKAVDHSCRRPEMGSLSNSLVSFSPTSQQAILPPTMVSPVDMDPMLSLNLGQTNKDPFNNPSSSSSVVRPSFSSTLQNSLVPFSPTSQQAIRPPTMVSPADMDPMLSLNLGQTNKDPFNNPSSSSSVVRPSFSSTLQRFPYLLSHYKRIENIMINAGHTPITRDVDKDFKSSSSSVQSNSFSSSTFRQYQSSG